MYLDQVVPRGPLLQHLLHILLGVRLSHNEIVSAAKMCPDLIIDPPMSKKLAFSIFMKVPPPGFKGFDNDSTDIDCFASCKIGTEAMNEAIRIFAEGGWEPMEESAQKYTCVAFYMQEVSPALAALSFGECSVLIRWATSMQHLGSKDHMLVPWMKSEEYERQQNALRGLPTGVGKDESYVKTWPELKAKMQSLLDEQPDGILEVSRLKLVFRSRFQTELSETVFGHCTLSDLLGDPEFCNEFETDVEQSNARRTIRRATAATAPKSRPLFVGAGKGGAEQDIADQASDKAKDGRSDSKGPQPGWVRPGLYAAQTQMQAQARSTPVTLQLSKALGDLMKQPPPDVPRTQDPSPVRI